MNNMRKKFFLLLAMLALVTNMKAQIRTLTLDSCRALAVNYNKELRMADKKVQAAYYERKAAFTKYLPRITATGAYLYTSKELSLLSDGQKEKTKTWPKTHILYFLQFFVSSFYRIIIVNRFIAANIYILF